MDKTKMAVDLFDHVAGLYQERFMDLTNYNASYDLFCSLINNPTAEILELACGPGNITRYLLSHEPGYRILATDLAENMLTLARKNAPAATFARMDCRDFLELNRQFDAVMCGFGLPYLSKEDAEKLITDASKALKNNGILYLSTMEDDYENSGIQKSQTNPQLSTYIHYHEAGYLTDYLENAGFEIVNLNRQEFKQNEGFEAVDLILIARKK